MAQLQNSSNFSKNSSQTPQLQNSLELPTLWSYSANGVEFWSTSFVTLEPPLLNLLVELVGNYPPMPLVTQKNGSFFFSETPPRLFFSVLRLFPPTSTTRFFSRARAPLGFRPPPPTSAAAIHPCRRTPEPLPAALAPPGHRQSEPRCRQS